MTDQNKITREAGRFAVLMRTGDWNKMLESAPKDTKDFLENKLFNHLFSHWTNGEYLIMYYTMVDWKDTPVAYVVDYVTRDKDFTYEYLYVGETLTSYHHDWNKLPVPRLMVRPEIVW